MGFVHYLGRAPSRAKLLFGEVPAWIKNSSRSRYIAAIVLSAPPWVDREALLELHRQAQTLTKLSGTQHVLDHIIPVSHPRVCGLTVPWNLRIVPWRVNATKSNGWNPEQLHLFTEVEAPIPIYSPDSSQTASLHPIRTKTAAGCGLESEIADANTVT